MNFTHIWETHLKRLRAHEVSLDYDPVRGLRHDTPFDPSARDNPTPEPRVSVTLAAASGGTFNIPVSMTRDPLYEASLSSLQAFERLRCRYDFEFWCARCVTIKDKSTGQYVPFILNRAQRHVTDVLESRRLAAAPLRLILLKARQWGGSTLIQMYMAWIQICLGENAHSLICAHVKDTAKSILGMYTTMLEGYPPELWDDPSGDKAKPAFKPFERSTNIRVITGRGCRVTVSSAECQEALRGSDIALAHLSEVAFWPSTPGKSPADYMRTVSGTVGLRPLTLVAMESTANGTGNFFHDEWQRCVAGKGDKTPIFVPWYKIEIYRLDIDRDSAEKLWPLLSDYELALWNDTGLDLGQIAWYHYKSLECQSLDAMHAEFPTTPSEAFVNSGANVFAAADIERMRAGCREAIDDQDINGLKVWSPALAEHQYMVTVDVGGRSLNSDFSVVAVFDREPPMTVCAQWRGHCDHDRLADIAMAVATRYNDALLVVESNTLETSAESQSGAGILAQLQECYPALYCRSCADAYGTGSFMRPGLHTNRHTKAVMIDLLIKALRKHPAPEHMPSTDDDRGDYYIERDAEACNELAAYVCLPNGSYAAPHPRHDDILMTRAMALYIASLEPTASRHDDSRIRDIAARATPWRP